MDSFIIIVVFVHLSMHYACMFISTISIMLHSKDSWFYIMYTLLSWRRFIKSDGSSDVGRPFSFPIFSIHLLCMQPHISHASIKTIYHKPGSYHPTAASTVVVTITTSTTLCTVNSTVLANRWLIRLPGFLAPSFVHRQHDRNQNTKHKLCICTYTCIHTQYV